MGCTRPSLDFAVHLWYATIVTIVTRCTWHVLVSRGSAASKFRPCSTHRIHGTGIFTYIYHTKSTIPCRYHIPFVPWESGHGGPVGSQRISSRTWCRWTPIQAQQREAILVALEAWNVHVLCLCCDWTIKSHEKKGYPGWAFGDFVRGWNLSKTQLYMGIIKKNIPFLSNQ